MSRLGWFIAGIIWFFVCFVGTMAVQHRSKEPEFTVPTVGTYFPSATSTTLQPQTCETTDGKTCAGQNDPTWCMIDDRRCTVQENIRHHMEISQQDKCHKEPDFMACMHANGFENY